MVSYGDSTAFNAVENAYDGCKVEKLDCVEHVQKRMGKHLMNLKATTKIAQNYLFKHTYHAHTHLITSQICYLLFGFLSPHPEYINFFKFYFLT